MLKTAGRWPWKSASAKECVTTHLPKRPALKMDDAAATHLYLAAGAELLARAACSSVRREAPVSRRERNGVRGRVLGVSLPGAAVGADLGGSSKYSGETLED